jgi:MYXO-CTERM domain-containing protein
MTLSPSRSSLLLATLLCSLALSRPARSAVVWTATFEANKSGDLCSGTAAPFEFKPGINETKNGRKNAEVLGEQVHGGSLACKITVHPDDSFTYNQNRVDIQHPSTLTAEGKDSYLSGWYMMPEDAKTRNEISFYESNNSFQNAMDMWVAPKTGGGTTINFAIGFLPDKAAWTADFKAGVWHQVAIHVHWSQMATVGYADIWLDGVKAVSMMKGKTKPNTDTLFFQTGLHRKLMQQVTDVIYFDDFFEGDAEADMHLATPGTSDGGVAPPADASGAAGAGTAGTAGSGGMTGQAGTTGAAGVTGTGGTSGAAGVTGTAGTPGAAGTGTNGAAGAGTASGAAGTGGSPAGAAGVSGAAGGPGATGTAGGGAEGAGCACALTNETPSRLGLIGAALLGAVIARRRRRRL